MSSTSFQSLKNHFLIAMPRMADPSFAGTLTLICEHNASGALGIIINRPTDLTLAEILDQVGVTEPSLCKKNPEAVFAGGPVAVERGFVIHSGRDHWDSTLPIDQNLKLTTSKDVLLAIANNEGPEEALVALGYAGWGNGQLEKEISENSWLTCKADEDIIFKTPFHHRLDAAARSMGVELSLLSDQVGHA